MDNAYLQELIDEAQGREGGLLLNVNGKPAAVVLTVEKYNQLVSRAESPLVSAKEQALPAEEAFFAAEQGKKILVTGGAGYIGAHIARELLKSGYEVVILDNLSTGLVDNVPQGAVFVEGDLADQSLLERLFAEHDFLAVMHLAASMRVEESVREPQKYFDNNVLNTAKLLAAMNQAGVKKIIFSSTCAVFGEQEQKVFSETSPLKPSSPYGFSKALAEKVIKYYCQFLGFDAVVFRYFNAAGSDFNSQVKATHEGSLLGVLLEVAAGRQPSLAVYGNDYPTPDGTCVRDFVHVLDIAGAHLAGLQKLATNKGFMVYNIGTGSGTSVLQMINTTSEVLNRMIPMEIAPRRPGDPAMAVADNTKLANDLGYTLRYSDLPTIISTAWRQKEQA